MRCETGDGETMHLYVTNASTLSDLVKGFWLLDWGFGIDPDNFCYRAWGFWIL